MLKAFKNQINTQLIRYPKIRYVSSENKIPNEKLSLDGYQRKDTSRNEISIDTCQIEGNKIPIEGKQEVSSSQKRARFQTNQTLRKFS